MTRVPRKKIVEYHIVRLTQPPTDWDGPYRTEAAAWRDWREHYANSGKDQDFAVVRITTEFLLSETL
jgi:hypothetical protein